LITPAPEPPAPAERGMRHRSYRGKILYLSDGIGETGREYFSVTVQPGGERTLRAQCEMDDYRLLRDIVFTLDRDWWPIDAFARLTIEERLMGTSWFHFAGTHAECQGFTTADGRLSQWLDAPCGVRHFGMHSLHADSWRVGRLRSFKGDPPDFTLGMFAYSILANGGSGPELIPLEPGFSETRDLGRERMTVPAGSFATRHVRVDVPGVDNFEIWAYGDDCVPVYLRSHGMKQSYELVELEGDAR